MRRFPAGIGILFLFASAAHAAPKVIMTEIMYNPASAERKGETEWIEIANIGDAPVELKQWRLVFSTRGAASWAAFDGSLAPGAVAVLINGDALTEEQFRAAWDDSADTAGATPSYTVIALKGWQNLTNEPKGEGSALQLHDESGTVVCEVKYLSGGDWPKLPGKGGPSIWLTDVKAANYGDGKLWHASEVDSAGARSSKSTEHFKGPDIGSPGIVPGLNAPAAQVDPPPQDKPEKPAEEKPAKSDNGVDY